MSRYIKVVSPEGVEAAVLPEAFEKVWSTRGWTKFDETAPRHLDAEQPGTHAAPAHPEES